ncbi:polysaccharide biosynthesis/export family protein [Erythrobacter sp. HKB08]|uniref:polysaccharide biosynthesis/export family protein n=1 Tax=Erythrobacter sp. HKB08 TaxID=2502843 RepID=UPI001008AD3B|nr:polysaccharide biosynthesis/export family protein [Erythrobacter sp. HKB08]
MTRFTSKLIAAFALATVLTGCAKDRSFGMSPDIEVAQLTELPAPAGVTAYTVGSQERIEVTVLDAERLSGTYLTDAEGYIAFPLVGDLYVGGKTPNQVAQMIADRLRGEYIVNPQVRVRPAELPVPSVSIGGEVEQPGTYPAATSQSLIRAINNAGGLAEYAKSDDVLIMRVVEGQRYIGVYNIEGIQRGNYADPLIYPGDIVTVGDSPSRRTLDTILQFIPLLSTSAILIDRTFN